MKRLNKLSETDFLKLFFLFLSTCFLVGAVMVMADPKISP